MVCMSFDTPRGAAFTAAERGLPRRSRAEVAQSDGLWLAAENLVRKVADALLDGDVERAHRVAERAAGLPYDEHQEMWPGVAVADQEIFNTLTDAVEIWPADEHSWVDAVSAGMAESPTAAEQLSHVAAILAHTATDVEIAPAEQARLSRIAGAQDPMRPPADGIPRAEHTDAIVALAQVELRLRHHLDEALAALDDPEG